MVQEKSLGSQPELEDQAPPSPFEEHAATPTQSVQVVSSESESSSDHHVSCNEQLDSIITTCEEQSSSMYKLLEQWESEALSMCLVNKC